MLVFKQSDYAEAVKVIQTICNTTEESAVKALERVREILQRRTEVNKIEASLLRDSFP